MRKWPWLKIGLVALVVLVLFLIVAQRDRGPVVDGRPLEEWVQDLLVTADPERRVPAQSAVAQLGTNAIPWLRISVRHSDPIWKQPLLSTVNKIPGINRQNLLRWVNLYERSEIRAGGAAGLAVLGQALNIADSGEVESESLNGQIVRGFAADKSTQFAEGLDRDQSGVEALFFESE